MVYRNNFVAVVKYNGSILRENSDIITLPFGSEYSLLFKNLSSQRAKVDVSIDGTDVLYGSSLILDPNSDTELTGFLDGDTVRNRFKFIQKTKQIQDYRGDKIDDGLIRVEYASEKVISKTVLHKTHHYHYDYYPPVFNKRGFGWDDNGITGVQTFTVGSGGGNSYGAMNCNVSNCLESSNDDNLHTLFDQLHDERGITVEGSKTQQDFQYASIGECEPAEVIILRLQGIKPSGKVVNKPLTTKTKLKCHTCGTKSKSNAKFCPQCGTSLEV